MTEEVDFSADKQRRTEIPRFIIDAKRVEISSNLSHFKTGLLFCNDETELFHGALVKRKFVNKEIQTFLDQILQKLSGCTSLSTLGKRAYAALQT